MDTSTNEAPDRESAVATAFAANRPELVNYLNRMVLRRAVAEELAQQVALRALESSDVRGPAPQLRAWFFRVATNLAIDHLRKHSSWRETLLFETRELNQSRPGLPELIASIHGSPETAAVVREHLAICFACTLRNLQPHLSAVLLLKNVYGFSTTEVSEALEATITQVKNWLQQARAEMNLRFEKMCALVSQEGVCYQCVELDEKLGGGQGSPLHGTDGSLDARMSILTERRLQAGTDRFHERVLGLLETLIDDIG